MTTVEPRSVLQRKKGVSTAEAALTPVTREKIVELSLSAG